MQNNWKEEFKTVINKQLSIAVTHGTGDAYNHFLNQVQSFVAQVEQEAYKRGLERARHCRPKTTTPPRNDWCVGFDAGLETYETAIQQEISNLN